MSIGKKRRSFWRRRVALPVAAPAGLMVVSILASAVVWSITRDRSFAFRVVDSGERGFLDQLPAIVALTGGSLYEGNRIELGHNGAFFESLLEDVAGAEDSIHLEVFAWWTGEVCRSVASALAEKRRSGVEVRVLVDGVGGRQMTEEEREVLQTAGVELVYFNPWRLRDIGKWNVRDHRKIVVIDGRLAYLFGHGISDLWSGNADKKDRYRDTYARIEGPIVRQIQGVFFENWAEETGEFLSGPRYFPPIDHVGETVAHLAWRQPIGDISAIKVLHRAVIGAAREELLIQNPYFLVEQDTIDAFRDAVARGVRVRLMMPSLEVTDHPFVQHAFHHILESLLDAGIEVLTYHRTLLHQKVIIVDNQWAAVGSSNFDNRSLELNDEVQIGIADAKIAQELKRAFEQDARYADVIELGDWKAQRSLWHQVFDWSAYRFHEHL